jgi:hypothetical protein
MGGRTGWLAIRLDVRFNDSISLFFVLRSLLNFFIMGGPLSAAWLNVETAIISVGDSQG